MRIINSNRGAPNLAAVKGRVTALIAGLARGADLDFAAVRADMGLDADQLPDGHIHQAAIDAGFEVRS